MILLRSFLLAASIALPFVVGVLDDGGGGVELKQCDGGDFEESYFNFDISIDNFSDDCDDFEGLGKRIQLMIEKVEMMIPEFDDEFIDATVCPLPTYVGEKRRHLGKRNARRGTYVFAGAGGCRRCRAIRAVRQRERHLAVRDADFDSENFEERVCETLVGWAVVDAAVAERSVAKAENFLDEMVSMAQKKETKKLLDEKQSERFVNDATRSLEECKEKGAFAKARALLFEKACQSEDFSAVVVTPEEQQGFEMVALNLEKELQKDTKDALRESRKVKEKYIRFKTEVVKARFSEMESTFQEDVKELEDKFREECDDLKGAVKKIQDKIKTAVKERRQGFGRKTPSQT